MKEKEKRNHLWGTLDLLLGSVSGFIVLHIRVQSWAAHVPATSVSHWTMRERD